MTSSHRYFVRGVILALVLCSRWSIHAQTANTLPQPQPRVITATAVVSGRVTDNAGVPVRSAEVRLRSNDGHDSRVTTTDDSGLYEIRDLVSGQWSVTASKAGYFSPAPPRAAASSTDAGITLADGQRLTVNLSLGRAGAIAGRILDDAGEPLAEVQVQALRLSADADGSPGVAVGVADKSDDTGAFRLYAIPPGTYYVRAQATPESVWVMPVREAKGLTNPSGSERDIYYPSTTDPQNAEPVKIVAGQDQTGIVIVIPQATAGVRVSGTILSSKGEPAGNDILVELVRRSGTGSARGGLLGRVSDGKFAVEGVPAGDYILSALGSLTAGQSSERGSLLLSVGTAAMDDVTVMMTPTRTLHGVVVTDDGTQSGIGPATLTVREFDSPVGGDPVLMVVPGSLSVPRIWGNQALIVSDLRPGWMVKSIDIGGHELGSGFFDFSSVPETATLRIVVTNRVGKLTGKVAGNPPDERSVVIVFPDDETKWRSPSRYITTATTGTDGAFQVTGLNAMHYLVVAVPWLDPGEVSDQALLSQLKRAAASVSMDEGETKTLNVPFVPR